MRTLPPTKPWQACIAAVALGVAMIYSYHIDLRFKKEGVPLTAMVVDKQDYWHARFMHSCYLVLHYTFTSRNFTDRHSTSCGEWKAIVKGQPLHITYLAGTPFNLRTPQEQAWALKWGSSATTQTLAVGTALVFAALSIKVRKL